LLKTNFFGQRGGSPLVPAADADFVGAVVDRDERAPVIV